MKGKFDLQTQYKNLYGEFNIKVVDVKRMINCDGKNRTGKDVIVTNYEIKEDSLLSK